MNLTAILSIGAFAAGLVVGGWAGYSWERGEVESLVATANKQVIGELKQANDDKDAILGRLHAAITANDTLENALSTALQNVRVEKETRIVWREKAREESTACAAWLDAPVPCRLRPDSPGNGNETGTRQAAAPKLRLSPISVEPHIRGAREAGVSPTR